MSRDTRPSTDHPSAARWARICAIFDAAVDAPEPMWDAVVADMTRDDPTLRDEVLRILAAEREDRFHMDRPRLVVDGSATDTDDTSRVGEVIGRYRLVRLIGSGGMGTVYEGVRADDAYHQHVAVKLIRPHLAAGGMAVRFRRERQILAALEHRNIARLLDGGATEHGEPFFVMEYVEGTPITKYCDEHRLTVPARLRLFLQACAAIQHAHGRLIVHRDIKPANILVANDGSVKLLDFGVARLLVGREGDAPDALGTVTQIGARALTPEYASPEQLRDEPAIVASDVYSLGIVLYELLAGCRPFTLPARSPVTMLRLLETVRAPRPSSVATEHAASHAHESSVARLRRRLAGELDNIVLKAIRVEPARRYGSVEQLANDIRRHLDGQPVTAQPDSTAYRMRKFVRRNAGAVMAAALAVVVLVAGAIGTGIQAHRADAQAQLAEVERARVMRMNVFLRDMLSAPDTRWVAEGERHGADVTVADVLDASARRAGVDLTHEPQVEAGIRRTIGRTYTALGQYARASEQLARSLALDRATGAPAVPDVVTDLHDLGMARFRAGDNATADSLFRAALRLCATHDQQADAEHTCGQSVNDLGLTLLYEGHYQEAERQFQQSLQLARQLLGPTHPAVGVVLGNIGLARDWRGDLPGAERYYREALGIFATAPREVADRNYALQNLGGLLELEGRLTEAESLIREAITVTTRTEGARHPETGVAWVRLGVIHREMGKLAEARVETDRGIGILTAASAAGNIYRVRAQTADGWLMLAERRPAAAVALLRQTFDTAAAHYPADDPRLAEVQDALGTALAAAGRSAAATPLLKASYATFMHAYGPTHPQTLRAERHLALVRRSS